jgi:hypothetical protein
MYALELNEQDAITLQVEDLRRSADFYRDLLGLSLEENARGSGTLRLAGLSSDQGEVRLVLRRADADQDHPDLWLSVEVETVTDVLDLYLLSIILGAHAMLPRKRADRWNTVITDPDGYRISVWTHVPHEQPRRFDGPRLTRADRTARWEPPARHGDDANLHDDHRRAGESQDARESVPGRGLEYTEPLGRGAAPAGEGV